MRPILLAVAVLGLELHAEAQSIRSSSPVQMTGDVISSAASGSYPGLNINKSQVRIDVGGLPQAWEFPNISQAGNHTTAAIAGSVLIPAGPYSGTYTWPDFGVMAHALTDNPAKNAVALFGYAGIGAAGAGAEALNGVVTNCELAKPSCTDGGGYNFANISGAEMDANFFLLPGQVAPTGGFQGYSVVFNAPLATVVNIRSSGFTTASASTGRLTNSFTSGDGASSNGISIGAANPAGIVLGVATPSDSQINYWSAWNSAGAKINATEVLDFAGTLHLQSEGVAFDNPAGATNWGAFSAAGLALTTGVYRAALKTPASSSATCTVGMFEDDTNYHYVCVATNTWKRVALSAF
jgi:hypothetical protein